MKTPYIHMALMTALLFIAAGCSRKPATLTEKFDEKKMEQAIAEAGSTFDTFLTRFLLVVRGRSKGSVGTARVCQGKRAGLAGLEPFFRCVFWL